MDEVEQPRQFKMTRRRWIILHVALILVIGYVSSYVYISRLRFEQYAPMRMHAFLYVSPASLSDDHEENWRIKHELMSMFYAPLNKIDREVLGSPTSNVCIMMGIGPKKK
jgi:hypothetical protein